MANLSGVTKYTVLARVYISDLSISPEAQCIFSAVSTTNSHTVALGMGYGSTVKIGVYVWTGSAYTVSVPSACTIGWHNVAMVIDHDTNTAASYSDGEFNSLAIGNVSSIAHSEMAIGEIVPHLQVAWSQTQALKAGGEIQFVRIVEGAMTSAEIDLLFQTAVHNYTDLHHWKVNASGEFVDVVNSSTYTLPAATTPNWAREFRTRLASLDPAHYYPLTETLGQGILDASPRGAHGKESGGVTLTQDGIVLDGVDDYAETVLADLFPRYSYYIEVAPDAVAIGQAFLGQHPSTGTPNTELLGLYDGGSAGVRLVGSAAGNAPASYPVDATLHFTAGQFTKLLRTVDASDAANTVVKTYVEGVLVDTQTYTAGVSEHIGLPWVLGQEWDSGPSASDFLAGKLKHFALFDRVLTVIDIATLFDESYDYASNAVFLFTADGLQDETTFTDISSVGSSVTGYGAAKIDTAQSISNGASLYLDGSSNTRLDVPYSTAIDFEGGPFTVEGFGRLGPTAAGTLIVIDFRGGSTSSNAWNVAIDLVNNYMKMYDAASSTTYTGTPGVVPALETWFHWAVSGDSNGFKLFLDGVAVIDEAQVLNGPDNSFGFYIGANNVIGNRFRGWMDDIAIVKEKLYTANFVPPAQIAPGTVEIFDTANVDPAAYEISGNTLTVPATPATGIGLENVTLLTSVAVGGPGEPIYLEIILNSIGSHDEIFVAAEILGSDYKDNTPTWGSALAGNSLQQIQSYVPGAFADGDVLNVALNCNVSGNCTFGRNGSYDYDPVVNPNLFSIPNLSTSNGDTIRLWVGLYKSTGGTAGSSITVVTNSADFAHAIPAGHSAWDDVAT